MLIECTDGIKKLACNITGCDSASETVITGEFADFCPEHWNAARQLLRDLTIVSSREMGLTEDEAEMFADDMRL